MFFVAKDRLTSRYWEVLIYPDSVLWNWKIIWKNNIILPLAVSPEHDPTKNLEVNVDLENKIHHHAILRYPNSTTESTIKKLMDQLYESGSSPKPIKVYDLVARYRYLVHLDDPEKQQFKEPGDPEKVALDKIECLCGFDIEQYKQFDNVEVMKLMDELEQIIQNKRFITMRALAEYLQLSHRGDLVRILRGHHNYFNQYMNGYLTEAKYEHDFVQLDDPDAFGEFES